MSDIEIRRLEDDDSLEALTALLHRGYAELGAMGYRYKAVDQSVDVTRGRIAERECYVVVYGGEVVGTALLSPPPLAPLIAPPVLRSSRRRATQPARDRAPLSTSWLGKPLMSHLEARAAELGAAEIAVDTSEGAQHLIALYERRGYRFITHAQWSHTNFRSVILSKRLSG